MTSSRLELKKTKTFLRTRPALLFTWPCSLDEQGNWISFNDGDDEVEFLKSQLPSEDDLLDGLGGTTHSGGGGGGGGGGDEWGYYDEKGTRPPFNVFFSVSLHCLCPFGVPNPPSYLA